MLLIASFHVKSPVLFKSVYVNENSVQGGKKKHSGVFAFVERYKPMLQQHLEFSLYSPIFLIHWAGERETFTTRARHLNFHKLA